MGFSGCGKNSQEATKDMEAVAEETVEVEIENLDDIKEDNTVASIETEFPEEMTLTIAVCGEPALSILDKAKEDLGKRGYGLRVIQCDDYNTPNEMVENQEALACLCEHEGFLTAYNKGHGTNLEIYKRIYYEPMAIYAGSVDDLNHIPDGATIAVPDNDVSVARALYLLDQKGILDVKPDCGFQASLEDIEANPHGIVIERKSPEDVSILAKEYSLYIVEMNQALAAGISESQALGVENRISPMFDYFAIGFVTTPDNEDSLKLRFLVEAIDSDRVQKYIEKEYRGSVVTY